MCAAAAVLACCVPHLVVWVAVKEVRVNGPVEGNQRSLRLSDGQLPRGDKIKIWVRPKNKEQTHNSVTLAHVQRLCPELGGSYLT